MTHQYRRARNKKNNIYDSKGSAHSGCLTDEYSLINNCFAEEEIYDFSAELFLHKPTAIKKQ